MKDVTQLVAAAAAALFLTNGAMAQESRAAPPTHDPAIAAQQGSDPSSVAAAPAKGAARQRRQGAPAVLATAGRNGNRELHKVRVLVSRYARSYGVPIALAHAVVRVESNYRANVRGAAGEIGLMQIKPATARSMGYSGSASGLFDPETNIKYGMKYLAKARELGGKTTCGTILKYNAGHGAKRMNPVSASYCAKVKQQMTKS